MQQDHLQQDHRGWECGFCGARLDLPVESRPVGLIVTTADGPRPAILVGPTEVHRCGIAGAGSDRGPIR